MRIYLDSRDHISLVERKTSIETDTFEGMLRECGNELVFSLHNIIECCAPLNQAGDETNVMRTLNRLESMPHIYIAEVKIPALELEEAISAFLDDREYSDADPFVPRFDYVVAPFEEPPTADYLKYGLAHTVYELWKEDPGLLDGYFDQAERLREILELDRARNDYKRHETNFSSSVTRNLRLYNITFPPDNIGDLSSWIYENPNRCPAVRLGYEVFHKLLRNITDGGEVSDIPDFAHVDCIPYVDAITLDNRMRGYVEQTDQSLGTQYSNKIYRHIGDIENFLQNTAT